MDEAMIDSEAAMVRFLNLIGSEPEIARIPIMCSLPGSCVYVSVAVVVAPFRTQ